MPDITPEELRESGNYSERKGALYDARLKRGAADTIERLQAEADRRWTLIEKTQSEANLYSKRIAELESENARMSELLAVFKAWKDGIESSGDADGWGTAFTWKKTQLRAEAKAAALEQQVAHLVADDTERDQHIREAAKRVLPADQVDGDRQCVPPIEDVVDAVVGLVAALRATVHELEESVSEAESRANERGRKMISCCFCGQQCSSLDALKSHSGECPEHPAVKQVAALRADAERLDVIINGMSTRDVADCHLCGRLREAADAAVDAARNAGRKGE